MNEQKDFFKELSNVFLKLNQQFRLTKIGKESALLIPVIYILGTFVQLVRNNMFGLPFYPMSLVQFTLITFYICFLLFIYGFVTDFLYKITHTPKFSILNIFAVIISMMLFCILIIGSLSLIMGSSKLSIAVLLGFVFFHFVFQITPSKSEILKVSIILMMCILFVMKIPISLGGFKGELVTFYEYSTDQQFTFEFYGHHEGMYYFTKDEEIYLVPTDSGYIKYKHN